MGKPKTPDRTASTVGAEDAEAEAADADWDLGGEEFADDVADEGGCGGVESDEDEDTTDMATVAAATEGTTTLETVLLPGPCAADIRANVLFVIKAVAWCCSVSVVLAGRRKGSERKQRSRQGSLFSFPGDSSMVVDGGEDEQMCECVCVERDS